MTDSTDQGPGTPDRLDLPEFPAALDPSRAAALLRWARQVPEPGETVGRYQILHPLGRGGMGEVHLAHDPVLDRYVALKFLSARLGDADAVAEDSREDRYRRLVTEARAASALDHPHIGTVYEIGKDGKERPYMAMAHYTGGTLRDRLAAGPLPPRDALRVADQIADGLSAAHRDGIVHRDVKPENLVFDHDDRVRIVDFGIAGSKVRGTTTGGTTAYMSPEQQEGDHADAGSDLWALGIVLHEMIVGDRPSSGADGAIRVSSALPPPLRSVLEQALEPNPADRFADAEAFRRALSKAGKALDAFDVRGRRIVAAAGTGVIAIALLAGGLVLGREMPRVTEARGSAAGDFDPASRVLVADFEAAEGLEDLALAAREAFLVDLQQSSFVTPLTRPQMGAALNRMGRAPDELVQGPLASELAQRVGAGAVIEAGLARAGSGVLLSGRALHPDSGDELFVVGITAGSDRLLQAVEDLSREMRERLGESRSQLARSAPLPEVTTHSIEALRLYAEADRAMLVDNERVRTLLDAALDRDSTFAMAHRLASAAATNRLSFSEAAHHMEQAWAHRDRLPERERLHVEAIYAANVTLDPASAARIFETLLDRFPDDSRAAGNLGSLRHGWLIDDQRAAADFRRALQSDPGSPFSLSYGIYLHFLVGDSARVDSLVAQAEQAGLAPFVERWTMVRAFADGDPARAITACDRLVDSGTNPIPQLDDLEMCGSIDVALGRIDSAIPRLERAMDAALAQDRHRPGAHAAQGLALAELLRGDRAAAADRLLDFVERVPADRIQEPDRFITRSNFRLQAFLMGDPGTAERIAAAYPPPENPDHWLYRGMSGLVESARLIRAGDGAGALRSTDTAFPDGLRPIGVRMWHALLRGMALELVGDRVNAEAEYAFAAHPGYLPLPYLTKDRLHLPVALAALHRIQARSGATERATLTAERLTTLGFGPPRTELDAVYPLP